MRPCPHLFDFYAGAIRGILTGSLCKVAWRNSCSSWDFNSVADESCFFLIRRPGLEIIGPVGQTILFHPYRVVLSDEVFAAVHPCGFQVLEAVERPVKVPPEIQVADEGKTFDGLGARLRRQRLEMGFTNKRREISCLF